MNAERKVIDAAQQALVGRTVVRVRYMEPAEVEALGWFQRGVVLVFDDGTAAYTACDEEGNDAGVLMVQKKRGELCLGRFPV
ncbi:MAG TPA: hypothetical protein VFV87_21520 [Pirellulaceae bacterium]|jgi:hypothetical protein|nr:hypothetical protein [Pirellulaceae bacterium]